MAVLGGGRFLMSEIPMHRTCAHTREGAGCARQAIVVVDHHRDHHKALGIVLCRVLGGRCFLWARYPCKTTIRSVYKGSLLSTSDQQEASSRFSFRMDGNPAGEFDVFEKLDKVHS